MVEGVHRNRMHEDREREVLKHSKCPHYHSHIGFMSPVTEFILLVKCSLLSKSLSGLTTQHLLLDVSQELNKQTI
jgi:hypothetical protein